MQTVLVTGASSGIGAEFTRIFAKEGYDLVITARNKTRLQTLARELATKYRSNIQIIPLDLGNDSGAATLYQEIKRKGTKIDILINNAGIGDGGPFVTRSEQKMLIMIMLNIVSLTHLTRLVAAEMVNRRSGRILNVASVAGFFPGPLMAVYYATKAYIVSFSNSLHEELKGTGVTVTTLCPGPTATNFQKRAGMEESWLFRRQMMSAARVAEIGYRGLIRGKRLVVPGLVHQVEVALSRFAPFTLTAPVIKRMHEN